MTFDISTVTSVDEALSVVQALREKFGMVGTEFVPQDIRDDAAEFDEIREIKSDAARHAKIEWLVAEITDSHEWRHLDDVMAETGNEVIHDILTELL